MTEGTIDQKLRGMAEHRGLKLVKSRKRKPGIGDYGKFGLTDAHGKFLLGMGKDGLTASAKEVEAYLRQGVANNWKASAQITPTPRQSSRKAVAAKSEGRGVSIRPRKRRKALGASEPARTADKSAVSSKRPRSALFTSDIPGRDSKRQPSSPVSRVAEQAKALKGSSQTTHEQVRLVVRMATPTDAVGLAALLQHLSPAKIDASGIARNLENTRKAGGGTWVAEQGEIIGCCSWATIQTLQHGPIGRIALLFVDKGYRRQGIATTMLEKASASLRKVGCSRIEAMSDIAISNAHNFFRTLKFEQASYRFTREIVTRD